ncbi:MAG: FIST N-terminal domain-containing protein [Campylobacterota bacterium]|nr:FIST N-terminal domain-containing protein [Campylobacterota bacterium]
MHTINYKYTNDEELKVWLNQNNFKNEKECLVQFFCGIPTKDIMQSIASILSENLPNAHIIGSTTDGEIMDDTVTLNSIIVSVSIFEKSKIYSAYANYDTNSYDMGYILAKKLDSKDAKAMILFTTGLAINGEHFLNGVREISNGNYTISGGLASDNGKFEQTYVSHRNKVIKKGAVGVLLSGDELNVKNNYILGWEAVGLPMKITKSKNNRVYELDNTPIIEIYNKYFTEKISKLLPQIGAEIPLIVKRNSKNIARATLNRYDDGSLLFAGNMIEGEEVRFGIGSVENILKNSAKICSKFSKQCNPESTFVYSCMARRRLLKSQANTELKIMASKATTSGFFTNGEFYSDKESNYLFNETLTMLALSEKELISSNETIKKDENKVENFEDNKMIYALTHMTNIIAKEWQEKLEAEILKNQEKDKQSYQQAKQAQMGEMIGMIAHQWRQPLNAISATSINLSLLSSMNMLKDEKVQKDSDFIQDQCHKMSETINTFMNFVKPAKESKSFQLSHTIDAIMQIMGAQLANHNIDVIIEPKDISIVGYEDLLEQVIINLLSNSRDAFNNVGLKDTKEEITDKFIKITIDKKDEIPLIIIEDNAGGIPKDIQEKVFNPYFTTKEQGKGTGIGLYMSMDIMKKSFGGYLKYRLIDNGSQFEIVLGGGR